MKFDFISFLKALGILVCLILVLAVSYILIYIVIIGGITALAYQYFKEARAAKKKAKSD